MGKISHFLVLILLFSQILPVEPSFGQERIALSLSSCLDIGLLNNIDIKIAKIDAKIEREGIPRARSIYDSVFEGKISYEDDQRAQASSIAGEKTLTNEYELGISTKFPSGTELEIDYSDTREWTESLFAFNNPLHTAELSATLEQPILKNAFGYVDRRSVKLSKVEAEIANIKSLDNIETSVADIEKAYWKLVFAYEDLALRKELLEQAEYLYKIFKNHVKTGFAESTELYEIEANMRIRKTELVIAENELKTGSNVLKLLLNEGGDFLILPTNKMKILGEKADFVVSLKEAFDVSREYLTKKKELESKKITLQMKENSLWPEIDLVGTLALNGVHRKSTKANRRAFSTGKHSMYYGGIEVTFPLENREAISEYNAANLENEKAVLKLIKAEKDLITDIDEKVRAVNLNLENANRWTKIKELQYRKYNDEEKKLRFGRSDSKTIIDYQNDLTSAAISEYRAMLDYYSALIDLENAKDTLLARVGVLEK